MNSYKVQHLNENMECCLTVTFRQVIYFLYELVPWFYNMYLFYEC